MVEQSNGKSSQADQIPSADYRRGRRVAVGRVIINDQDARGIVHSGAPEGTMAHTPGFWPAKPAG